MGKISSYTSVTTQSTDDLLICDQDVGGTLTTKKTTVGKVGTAVAEVQTYAALDTTNKTIIGAINEVGSLPDTATGSIATFTTSLEKPLVECECEIVASGGGGTPSTPIPIVGYTGMTITRNDGENPPVEEDTYSVTWQTETGTIYGGSLNVTSGVLTVKYASKVCRWGDVTGTNLGDNTRKLFAFGSGEGAKYPPTADKPQLCDKLTYLANYSSNTAHFYCNNTHANIFMPNDTSADTTITVVYELANPTQTYQLTPTEIETLVGTNNVFHDCNGNTSVTYLETIKEYIDKRVTP